MQPTASTPRLDTLDVSGSAHVWVPIRRSHRQRRRRMEQGGTCQVSRFKFYQRPGLSLGLPGLVQGAGVRLPFLVGTSPGTSVFSPVAVAVAAASSPPSLDSSRCYRPLCHQQLVVLRGKTTLEVPRHEEMPARAPMPLTLAQSIRRATHFLATGISEILSQALHDDERRSFEWRQPWSGRDKMVALAPSPRPGFPLPPHHVPSSGFRKFTFPFLFFHSLLATLIVASSSALKAVTYTPSRL